MKRLFVLMILVILAIIMTGCAGKEESATSIGQPPVLEEEFLEETILQEEILEEEYIG